MKGLALRWWAAVRDGGVARGGAEVEQPVTRVGQPPEQLFPVAILPFYIALTMLAATAATVLAALLPARRAARLNPVDVIR